MSDAKTTAFEQVLLELIFENTDLKINGSFGDAGGLLGSATAGTFSICLFTADPTEAGLMANECDYTNYARVTVARDNTKWDCTAGVTANLAAIEFPAAGVTTADEATYFGICVADVEGVADCVYYGALTASLTIDDGITPSFAIGALTVAET